MRGTRPRSRRWVAPMLALALAGAGCGGDDGGDPSSLVVLGDSFASGEGVTGSEGACGRSERAFAGLVAGDLEVEVAHVACTGARTEDVEGQIAELGGDRHPVAVLSIGGNDAGYATVLGDCLGLDDVARALTRDDDVLEVGCTVDADDLRARADALRPRLVEVYRRVVDEVLTDDGRLLVLTYPQLFEDPADWPPEEGARCDGIGRDDVEVLREAGAALRRTIEDAVAEVEHAELLDLTDLYAGHGRCGGDPWINGLTLRPRARASFHPSDEGHRATADAMVAVVAR